MRISDWSSDVCSSDLRDDGPLNVAAKSGASRLRPSANPKAETMTAEASTRARLGYHDGAATSRNASTLPGLIMAEPMRPKPKMSPEDSAKSSFTTVSKLHDVPSDVHSRSRLDKEEAGRGKQAGHKTRKSND